MMQVIRPRLILTSTRFETLCRIRHDHPSDLYRGTNNTLYRNMDITNRYLLATDGHRREYYGYVKFGNLHRAGISKEQWAHDITHELVPTVHRMLHGNVSDDDIWRSDQKRSEIVQVTKEELKVIGDVITCRTTTMTSSVNQTRLTHDRMC